jgi:hypothetical protein
MIGVQEGNSITVEIDSSTSVDEAFSLPFLSRRTCQHTVSAYSMLSLSRAYKYRRPCINKNPA